MNPTTNETVSFHPQPEATENQVSAIKILFLNSRNDLWIATENALIVYDYQIRVNTIFLNFQIISIGKIRNNELNIPFV